VIMDYLRIPPPKHTITVLEARKLLGSDSKSLTDTQVQEIIRTLSLIARRFLNAESSKITEGNDIIKL
jgi:ribonuclease HIII